MIIDVCMGWLPENFFKDEPLVNTFIRSIPRAYGEDVKLTPVPGREMKQIVISKPKGYENLNVSEMITDSKGHLAVMDEAKVDKAVLRVACWQEWLDLETCQRINNEMAKSVGKHPDRFLGLATVPPWGDKECDYELDRCIKELGLHGVVCAAHYGTLYLDAEEFKPYFKKLNELGVPVCIHHTPLPVAYGSIYEYANLRRYYGRCIDQMTCICRVLFSGLLDKFPNLRLIHTLLGGGFFAYTSNLVPRKSEVKEEVDRFDMVADKIKGYLDRNIYFDMSPTSWTAAQIKCAIEELGADHILFGGHYPVRREWLLKGPEYLRSLDIGEKAKRLILGENAMRLFKIKA
ncbi:MAG: hypothetical protein A2144_12395 [Chloroflexi bacterium RBG_16_50_9]|nr:MAG: hypothetical protein A2144_12395 [Chloroflexi bacterium RBG_16_50_9]